MYVLYILGGLFAIVTIAFFLFLNKGAPEAKNIKLALEAEKNTLEKFDYTSLEDLVKRERDKQISFENTKFRRILIMDTADKGHTRTMQVKIVLQGVNNSGIEESSAIIKSKSTG